MSNIFIGLKKTCLGVLDRENRDKDNETDLKEEGGIEMSTTVLHSRCSLREKRNKNLNYSALFAMLAPSLLYFTYLLLWMLLDGLLFFQNHELLKNQLCCPAIHLNSITVPPFDFVWLNQWI
jgi:hypothetical protein